MQHLPERRQCAIARCPAPASILAAEIQEAFLAHQPLLY